MKDCLPCKAKRKNARPWMGGGIAFLDMSFPTAPHASGDRGTASARRRGKVSSRLTQKF